MASDIQHVIAPALTEEERRFLFEQRNSEHFRVFTKAITWAYSLAAAKLVTANRDDLSKLQGVLEGLLTARGIILAQAYNGTPSEEELKSKISPIRRS